MKLKFASGLPDAKSWASTVTAQPAAGHAVAARAEVVTDGVKATAVRDEAGAVSRRLKEALSQVS